MSFTIIYNILNGDEKMISIGNFTLPYAETYLIIVNLLGFILHTVNAKIKKKKGTMPANPFLILLSIIGGAAGILLSVLFFDIKADKENMMLRVTSICFFIISVIAFLIYKGNVTDVHHFSFWQIFTRHKFLLYYLCGINLLTLIIFGVDKLKAKKEKERIKITTLLLLSGIGGSIGGLIAMYLFRHKTKKSYFAAGIPIIIITQIALIIYLMNSPWFPK